MAVYVALLRGINVGGKTTLPMADLRQVATDLGYEDVGTYIQSGNLLFRAGGGAATIARDLERAIAGLGGVRPAVHLRTRAQLQKVVDDNPFLPQGADPKHLHVVFTDAKRARVDLDDLERYAPEEVVAVGREVHLHLPGGVGRSKLAGDLAKRGDGAAGTMRSWRTVTKLLELAEALG